MLHRNGNSSSRCAILITGIVNLLAATSKTRPFRTTTLLYDKQAVDTADILLARWPNYPVYVQNLKVDDDAITSFLKNRNHQPVLNAAPERLINIRKSVRHVHRLPYQSMIHLIIISQPNMNAIMDIKDIALTFDERNLVLVVIDYQTMRWDHLMDIQMFLEVMWERYKLSRIAVMLVCHKGIEEFRLEVRTYHPYLKRHQRHSWRWDDLTSSLRGETDWDIVFRDRTRNLYGSSFRISIIVNFSNVFNMSGPGHQNKYRLGGSGVLEMQTFADCLNASLELILPNFESVEGINLVSENYLQFVPKRSLPIHVQESIWKLFSRQRISSQSFYRQHNADLVAMLSVPNLHSRIVLYPLHLFEFVALVPNLYQSSQASEAFLFSVILLPPMNSWYIVAVLLAILRKALRCVVYQPGDSRLTTLCVDNMGILMATSSGMRLHGGSERVLCFFMSLSAFVMGLVVTTISYQGYYNNIQPLPLVDNLADIIKSDLNIWISRDNHYVLGEETILALLLRKNGTSPRIYDSNSTNLVTIALRSSINDRNAFLVDKSTAESILAIMRMNTSKKPPLRMMTNRIAQQLQGYWLPYPSSLETAINTLHLHYVEHGLQQYHESLNSRINYQYYSSTLNHMTWLDLFIIESLDSSIYTFQSSAIMLIISIVVFLLEVAVHKIYRK